MLDEVNEVRQRVADAADLMRTVAEQNRVLVARLVFDCKLSGRDAETVLGVSPQRVSQLLKESEHVAQ